MYRSLDADQTVATIETLSRRIDERFPSSGLGKVCIELCAVAHTSKERAEWIAQPNYLLRGAVGLIVLLSFAALIYSVSLVHISTTSVGIGELIQASEAAINEVVLIGAAVFFLVTVEIRIKRSRTLEALHELRCIAHVIDMHQLTKDPASLSGDVVHTASSPRREMSAYELTRYLDYCSEMLSLTGKVAALYGQNFKDSVVLSAVNDLESMTTGLCRKIWQKIMILHKLDDLS
jgi:hypothetical protein